MSHTILGFLVRVLNMIFPWIMRKIITKNKILCKVEIELSSVSDPFTLICPTQQCLVWLKITNHNDFPLFIDRLEIDFNISGATGCLRRAMPDPSCLVPGNKTTQYFLKDFAPSCAVSLIKSLDAYQSNRLEIKAYITSELHNVFYVSAKESPHGIRIIK